MHIFSTLIKITSIHLYVIIGINIKVYVGIANHCKTLISIFNQVF